MKITKFMKKISGIILTFVLILTANIGLMGAIKQIPIVNATSETNLMPNANFMDYNASSYMPNSYTASANAEISNVETGVINLTDSKNDKFNIPQASRPDNYALKISSADENDNVHHTYFGYETTNAIELSSSSYYRITIDVLTDTNAGIGSLLLRDADSDDIVGELNNISSFRNWTTYYFYIKTDDENNLNVKLGLYLNGSGTILFDSASCFEVTKSAFETEKESADLGRFYYYDAGIGGQLEEFDMTTTPFSQEYLHPTDTSYEDVYAKYTTTNPGSESFDGTHNSVFEMHAKDSYIKYATSEDFLTLDQNSVYKVSLYLKAVDISTGNANIKLIETNNDYESNELSISTTNGDFKAYSFFVRTFADVDDKAKIQIVVGLGDDSSSASGTLYISNITLSKISYSTFNSADNNNKFDLVSKSDALASDKYVDNGNFNAIEVNSDYSEQYPAVPTSWTVTKNEDDGVQKYGVVNTSASEWAKLKAGYAYHSAIVNPYDIENNNNVLMLYNHSANSLSYTSTSRSLSAQTDYIYNLTVQAQNADLKIELITSKDDSEIVLASKTVDAIIGTGKWTVVQFNLATGYQSLNVQLRITLTSDSYACAFVDNVIIDKSIAPKADANNTIDVDLKNILAFEKTDSNYAKPNYFTGAESANVQTGVVNLDDSLTNNVIDEQYATNLKNLKLETEDEGSSNNRNVLAICTDYDYETNYTLTSDLGFTLSTDKYYKIVVYVFTSNLHTSNEETEPEDLGASISLTNFDKSFSKINTNNSWSRYVFYVHPTTEVTSYLTLSIGSSETSCAGRVFFGNIIFEEIEENKFTTYQDGSNVLVLADPIVDEDNNDDEEGNETGTNNNTSAWIYAIPSLLFALALVICIVGVMVRKMKFKKPVKKTKNAYDRNKTVSKQYYTRKATALREERLRDLNKELENLTNQRASFEEEYKRDLTKLRELKIKRASASEINKLDKEMKKNRRLSATIGVNINNITNEINYTKTDQYLTTLIKKLSSEQPKVSTEETVDEVEKPEQK